MNRILFHCAVLAIAHGCLLGCGDAGTPGPDPDGGDPDGGDGCEAGMQDVDGDGTCSPDCSAVACVNGTCSVDEESGLAACACGAGFKGDACDELVVPSAEGVAFWVDASDAASRTLWDGGTTIDTWTDKGEEGLLGTTTDAPTGPTLVELENGLAVARFDGENDAVQFTGFDGIASSDYTIFAVIRAEPEESGRLIDAAGEDDLLNDAMRVDVYPDEVRLIHIPALQGESFGDHDVDAYGEAGLVHDQLQLVTIRKRGTDIGIWVDGNSLTERATLNALQLTETLTLVLGNGVHSDEPFSGDIAEIIIVPDGLIYEDRLPYEDYLAAKWFGRAFERNPTAFGVTSIWLDASQASTITTVGSGSVTAWSNLGYGQGHFGNASFDDARPTLLLDALNGNPVVHFDGGDTIGQNEIMIQDGAFEGDYTIFAVLAAPATDASQIIARATFGVDNDLALRLALAADDTVLELLHRWPAGDSGGDALVAAADLASARIVKIERSALASYHVTIGDDMHDVMGSTDYNIPNFTDLNWTIGGETISAPGAGLEGDVAEIIVLDGNIGQSEESALMASLAEKWGL